MKTLAYVLSFLAIRLLLFLSLPLEGLTGYGDLGSFAGWVSLRGWPFLDHWMEFPPLFPFLAEVLYRLVGGSQHAFSYLLVFLFTLAQAASIALFLRIANVVQPNSGEVRGRLYLALLTGLFYGWAYFDPVAVLLLLLGIFYTLQERPMRAALAFGVGALVKWFPLLGMGALFLSTAKQRGRAAALASAVIIVGWGAVLLASPDFTLASLRSQSAKGSWETVWALLDGNLGTGNFGAFDARFDPQSALTPQGNPPILAPLITLLPFAALGLWKAFRARLDTPRSRLALTALALCLFFLWSPGWSPQWLLYLLPLILLLMPVRRAVLLGLLFVLVNLLEWPLLLSRGLFWGLYLTVPLRTLLLILLARAFWRMIPTGRFMGRADAITSGVF